ncbi:MAG: hypothetical protein GY754_24910 [bacterium]|nr:hypothetical protein [bacterium]
MEVKFFGQYLVDKGIISSDQLREAVDYQKSLNKKLGSLAVQEGLLTNEQIDSIRAEQKKKDKMFGEIALEMGLLTNQQVYTLLEKQRANNIPIGGALVTTAALTESSLKEELAAFKQDQATSEKESKKAINKSSKSKVVETFINTTARMISRLSDIHGKIYMSYRKFDNTFPYKWNVYEQLKRDINGYYILSLSADVAKAIVRTMIGVDSPEEEDYFEDIINEFTSIAVGNAASNLIPMNIEIMPARKFVPEESPVDLNDEKIEIIVVKMITLVGDFQILMAYTP